MGTTSGASFVALWRKVMIIFSFTACSHGKFGACVWVVVSSWVPTIDLKSMFELWFELHTKGIRRNYWGCLFLVVIWSTWKYRNQVIFEGEAVNWEAFSEQIKLRWKHWCEQWCKEPRVGGDTSHNNILNSRQIAFPNDIPSSSYTVDGICKNMKRWCICVEYQQHTDQYTLGGYLTDAKGDLICALIDYIDATSLTYVEISALEMSSQFILEEVGCQLHELNLCSYSRILVSMLDEDYIPN